MRPSPDEVIAGVRRILRDVVEPEVSSEYARSRLREAVACLGQVNWNDAVSQVERQSERYRGLLLAAREWIADDDSRASAFSPVTRQPQTAEAQRSFAELGAIRDQLADQLVVFTRELAAWTRRYPADESAAALRSKIMAELALPAPQVARTSGT
jgi:hypothetical protein